MDAVHGIPGMKSAGCTGCDLYIPDDPIATNDTEREGNKMTSADFIAYAKTFGYGIQFTGIGMAYVTLGEIKLTETMDTQLANNALAQIGMAIMVDTMRTEDW